MANITIPEHVREQWVSARWAAQLFGVSPQSAGRVLKVAGNVRRKSLPGMHEKYWREDVERLASTCVEVGASSTHVEDAGKFVESGIARGQPGQAGPSRDPGDRIGCEAVGRPDNLKPHPDAEGLVPCLQK